MGVHSFLYSLDGCVPHYVCDCLVDSPGSFGISQVISDKTPVDTRAWTAGCGVITLDVEIQRNKTERARHNESGVTAACFGFSRRLCGVFNGTALTCCFTMVINEPTGTIALHMHSINGMWLCLLEGYTTRRKLTCRSAADIMGMINFSHYSNRT